MNDKSIAQLNGMTEVWRIITPIMTTVLSVLVTIILFYLGTINKNIDKLDVHFTNHLTEHRVFLNEYKDNCVKIEHRFTALEQILKSNER